jgi:hypothetical protein
MADKKLTDAEIKELIARVKAATKESKEMLDDIKNGHIIRLLADDDSLRLEAVIKHDRELDMLYFSDPCEDVGDE